ncbi:MAG: ATP-dependent RecD-like DNA helicase [Lachnospiraceae bacterium]|nr:ATP-dependent RecD-like DNA helicase [Lachnospiraceae bacterium]
MTTIEGYVDHIIFRNETNAYTVLVMKPDDPVEEEGLEDPDEITCVGVFPSITAGENLRVSGIFTVHESFGKQLKVSAYEEIAPKDTQALYRYLSSGAVKGVGEGLAKRIIDKFGDKTFEIMEVEPERLAEVKGISARKAIKIAEDLRKKHDQRQVMLELSKLNVTTGMALKIYNQYGQTAMTVIKKNPYRLAEEVDGIGFKTADDIAMSIGFSRDSEERTRSGILYVLGMARTDGNTYMRRDDLVTRSSELLGVTTEQVESLIFDLTMNRKIKTVGEAVYLFPYYRMEERTAAMMLQLTGRFHVDEQKVSGKIDKLEKEEGMTLDENQREAVAQAAESGVLILTGGPGTGKTTTIRTIISYFESEGMEVRLAAPTGRAAKRMTQAVGQEAQTIHRLLEVQKGGTTDDSEPGSNPGIFARNEENPIEGDVVIIDEMSMVDITLMYSLLRAIPAGTRLVLVGDVDQLPSVGPGNVLKDLINSGAFPVVRLTNIFRQAETSDIVLNAHRIKNGDEVKLDNKSRDFFFLKRYDSENVIGTILSLLKTNLPAYVNAGVLDIQVLSPMRRGQAGVERLNRVLQQQLNPPDHDKEEKTFGDIVFREGDKVMQTKNDYDVTWRRYGKDKVLLEEGSGIFNGDCGIIKEVNGFSSDMLIEFDDGHFVEYPFSSLENLSLAYAMTIHKSQGSEYPAVIIPLLSGPEVLYNRNLLYTAVTRAKKCVILVGDEKVFYSMEKNDRQRLRLSGLKDRILEQKESEKYADTYNGTDKTGSEKTHFSAEMPLM